MFAFFSLAFVAAVTKLAHEVTMILKFHRDCISHSLVYFANIMFFIQTLCIPYLSVLHPKIMQV